MSLIQRTEEQRDTDRYPAALDNVTVLRAQAIPDPATSITLPVSTVNALLAAHDEARTEDSEQGEALRKLLEDLGHD